MSSDDSRYWFPAKRYGWGWGLPSAWEGWAVMVAYFVLLACGACFLFPPMQAMTGFIVYVAVLTIVLTVICWRKGEPPRWRWGGE
jgi:hypothetical protein